MYTGAGGRDSDPAQRLHRPAVLARGSPDREGGCKCSDQHCLHWYSHCYSDLGDIKVTGKTQLGTHALQFRSLDRPMFQAQPDLIQSPRILAETMIGSFGRFDLQLEIGWQFDLQPTRQRSFPGSELPLLTTFAVFAALYERALDLDFGS